MTLNEPGKKYESAIIPPRQQTAEGGAVQALPLAKKDAGDTPSDGLFYEIEYNSSPWEDASRFAAKPQKIAAPEKDEIRELFYAMREIARANRTLFFSHSNAYDRRVRQENSRIFYKQALFMKDFVDHYSAKAPYSSPFPSYQMMGYEQLRTYFTWRTQVRQGNVANTSIAYAFLYIYELLNNIGVENPAKGLDKLMFFWKAFRKHNKAIDKYILAWLKDYHIYYQLPGSFKEFITQKNLARYYPSILDTDDSFDLFAAISRYDIGKSSFYSGDNIRLCQECFHFIIERLRQVFQDKRIDFDETIFQPAKKMYYWQPFKEALFYHWLKPPDRQIVLSENEIYFCSKHTWYWSNGITTEPARQLVSYIIKQMESVLRKLTGYKYKLSADITNLSPAAKDKFHLAGLRPEAFVTETTVEYYRKITKTIVKVDHSALTRIRQEALITQKKLIVPEQNEQLLPTDPSLSDLGEPPLSPLSFTSSEHETLTENESFDPILNLKSHNSNLGLQSSPQGSPADIWNDCKKSLTALEIEALALILAGNPNLKQFADKNGVMLEVLIEGINEKAMDFIGDSLMDDEFRLYDEYKDQVKELIE